MREEKVAANIFIVMGQDAWPSGLEQIKVYATRELARVATRVQAEKYGVRHSYLERAVIEKESCPHCGAEKGGD